MSSPTPPPDRMTVESNLHDLAQLLRRAEHLEPKVQLALAEIVEELGQALHSSPVPTQELIPLAQSTTELIEALHQKHQTVFSTAREKLKHSILQVENRAPFVAQLAGRLLDTLGSSGI